MNGHTILLFHSVDDRDLLSFRNLGNIHPDLFEKLIVFLKKECDLVSLREMASVVAGLPAGENTKSGSRLLALTFDDGPKSYATKALPLLKSHDIPSTCFLITDCIDDRKIYWRYLFNYCIQSGRESSLAALIRRSYNVKVDDREIISFTRGHFSKEANRGVVEGILKEIVSEEEYRKKENNLFLSFDDLEKLKKEPLVEFGIHTRSHPVMSHLNDDEITDEIKGSLEFYRRNIGPGAPMFSLPFGRLYKDYDERPLIAARQLGMQTIFSAYGGDNKSGQPLYNLRRISVNVDMLADGIKTFGKAIDKLVEVPDYQPAEKRLEEAMSLTA